MRSYGAGLREPSFGMRSHASDDGMSSSQMWHAPSPRQSPVRDARADGRGLRPYLASIVGRLNDPGKELVVKTAFFVAAADGTFTDEETALLAELAGALEMSPSHFKGVVDDLVAITEREGGEHFGTSGGA